MNFNSSITQAAAKAMEHLTDFVFITIGNTTLARHDAYLSHLKNGIKPDTLAALRTAPTDCNFVSGRSDQEGGGGDRLYDSKGQSSFCYVRRSKGRYHPYERVDKKSEGRSESKQDRPAWKNIGRRQFKRQGKVCKFFITTCQGAAVI